MLRDVLASVSITLLAGTAAFGQPLLPLLTATPVSRTIVISLDTVQTKVDAALKEAADSKRLIAGASSQPALPLLASTPIPRR